MSGPHKASPPALLVHGALFGVSVLFGLNYVWVKVVLEAVPARAWACYRLLAATAVMVPIALWFDRDRRTEGGRRQWLWLVPAALLGVTLNQALFALGMEKTTPGHSSVLNTTIPIFTLGIAALVGQERLDAGKVGGIVLALCGVLTLLGVDEWFAADSGAALSDEIVLGDLLILCNCLAFSAFLVLMRRVGRRVPAMTSTALCFVFGLAMLLVWGGSSLDGESLDAVLHPDVLGYALGAILGATVLTYLVNNWALQHAQSSQVALYIYAQPIVATALSVSMGRDEPGLRFFLAGALVFAGLVMDHRSRRKRTVSP